MFDLTPETTRKVLCVVRNAGGTIKSSVFARVMWTDEASWKPRPKKPAKGGKKTRLISPEARMTRRAGTILGRVASLGPWLSAIGPQTWTLTEEGWSYLSEQDSKGRTQARTTAPKTLLVGAPRGTPPARQAIVTLQGRRYSAYAAAHDPRYPQYVSVIWAPNMAPQFVPAACVQWA